MQGILVKYLFVSIMLTFCAATNAAYIVESSPGIVTGISGLDIDGTLYNVDFEAVNNAFSTFGGNEYFWGDSDSAHNAVEAVNSILNQGGYFNRGALNNGQSTTGAILAAYGVWHPNDSVTSGFILENIETWNNFSTFERYSDVGDASGTAWSLAEVPLPAAVWLFVSALLGLARIKRRKS